MRTLASLLLVLLLLGASLAPARATGPRPLAEVLNPDGTLRPGGHGPLDATGWALASGLHGAPHFVPAGGGWSELGGAVNQTVNDIIVDDNDDVYIAGTFTEVGGVSTAPLNMIARWDGTTWTSLGGANDWIFALALAPDGTLYAAGRFTQIGGVAATRVAMWNGSTWAAMGPGFNNPPEDMVVDSDGTLYVGGGMNVVGGGSPRAIFAWTGSAWVVPGGGNGVDNQVYGMAIDAEDNLYVAGNFTSVSGVTARDIARWDGTSWSDVGGGTPPTSAATIYTVEVGPSGDVFAGGGAFNEVGGVAVNDLARWDGTAWHDVAGGVSGATGGGTAVRDITFDGAGLLYICGSFTEAGGVTVNSVARLSGGGWESLAGGIGNGVVLTLAVANNLPYLYAGGGYSSIGGVSGLNYFAKYEGGVTSPVEPEAAPAALTLDAAFPNPFAHTATLRFSVQRAQAVRLELFDALGRRVALLHDGAVAAGLPVEVRLDGRGLPAGTYVARLTGEGGHAVRRLTLAR